MPGFPPTMTSFPRLLVAGCGGALLLALSGCGDKDITSYRIPKEPAAAVAADTSTGAPAASPAETAGIRWTAPVGWQQQPASGMRQGSFTVPGANGTGADVSVISFPGTGGDDLANLNRWRNQLQLPPVAAADLSSQMQSVTAPAGKYAIADLTGTVAEKGVTRILGGWLRQPDRVWFFKMMGPADLVGAQRDAFMAFLQSVSLGPDADSGAPLAQGAPNSANTNDLPRPALGGLPPPVAAGPVDTGGSMDSIPVQAESGASLHWDAPPDWQNEPGRPMRKGSYSVGGGAEVAITAFPGNVGGFLANVNRWRGQAGLPPVDDAGLAQAIVEIDSNGLHLILVDATSGSPPLMAALLPWNGGTWFFKLTGTPDAVANAKPAFLAFLKTVRAP